jgi:hypothetical protein
MNKRIVELRGHIQSSLSIKGFTMANKLKIGRDIFNYTLTRENGTSWKGKLVGYPLVEITDREVIKEKILDKLFS